MTGYQNGDLEHFTYLVDQATISTSVKHHMTFEEYMRAANYLSAAQIFLQITSCWSKI